jgi:ABC-2 type transport system permease protein
MQYKGFKTMSLLANGAIVQTALRTVGLPNEVISATLQPYQTHVHALNNPFTNYNFYLNSTFVPCFFSLFILLVTAFSLGLELKSGLSRQWLKTAGDSMFLALVGKLVPQTVLFTAVGWFIQWIMFRCYDFPLNCNPWNMLTAMFLLVVANQSFAVLMYCFVPNFRYGTMLCTLLGMVSFSFSGFSLPQESMYSWVTALGFVMPIKYYFLIMVDQALNGIDLYYSRFYYAALIGFTILPMLLSWHLKKECMNPVYVP